MTKPSIYLFRYHGNEHMDPHFSVCFLTWYGISFKKNLGSLNYYGPKKSSVNVASILNNIFYLMQSHQGGHVLQWKQHDDNDVMVSTSQNDVIICSSPGELINVYLACHVAGELLNVYLCHNGQEMVIMSPPFNVTQ